MISQTSEWATDTREEKWWTRRVPGTFAVFPFCVFVPVSLTLSLCHHSCRLRRLWTRHSAIVIPHTCATKGLPFDWSSCLAFSQYPLFFFRKRWWTCCFLLVWLGLIVFLLSTCYCSVHAVSSIVPSLFFSFFSWPFLLCVCFVCTLSLSLSAFPLLPFHSSSFLPWFCWRMRCLLFAWFLLASCVLSPYSRCSLLFSLLSVVSFLLFFPSWKKLALCLMPDSCVSEWMVGKRCRGVFAFHEYLSLCLISLFSPSSLASLSSSSGGFCSTSFPWR